MAAKKKAAAQARRAATRPRAPARKARPRPPGESAAVRLLGELPPVDSRLRRAFRLSFTEAQCEAWGELTTAAEVVKEAQGWLTPMASVLSTRTVAGYSLNRLAFVVELLVELEDQVAAQAGGGEQRKGARSSALTYGRRILADLSARLAAIAGGFPDLKQQLHRRLEAPVNAQAVRDSLTGLIDLGNRWRRDAMLELLADDADLTPARLNRAYNALEALARTDEVLAAGATDGEDSTAVNRIEGRVLRELKLAETCFKAAREGGETVPSLVPGPMLRRAFLAADQAEAAAVARSAAPPDVPPERDEEDDGEDDDDGDDED